MKVRIWGVRGSIPTPGPTTARYGGNTVCVEVRTSDGTLIVLDAGTGMRELGKSLLREKYSRPISVLITHQHFDHIMGLPFFAPVWQSGTLTRLYPLANAVHEHQRQTRVLFDGVHFPVRFHEIPSQVEFVTDESDVWQIGSAKVRRTRLNHPGGSQGFRIDDADGSSMAYLTDNELSCVTRSEAPLEQLATFAHNVDLLIHDTQYVEAEMAIKRGWGHSTLEDVLVLAQKAGTPHLVLFHHDPERDDVELEKLGERASTWLAQHAPSVTATVAYEGMSVDLPVQAAIASAAR